MRIKSLALAAVLAAALPMAAPTIAMANEAPTAQPSTTPSASLGATKTMDAQGGTTKPSHHATMTKEQCEQQPDATKRADCLKHAKDIKADATATAHGHTATHKNQ